MLLIDKKFFLHDKKSLLGLIKVARAHYNLEKPIDWMVYVPWTGFNQNKTLKSLSPVPPSTRKTNPSGDGSAILQVFVRPERFPVKLLPDMAWEVGGNWLVGIDFLFTGDTT